MSTFHTFEEIEAWQRARALAHEIYRITKYRTFRSDFALRNQVRRAVISITSNIAEGFDRGSNREFANFPSVAAGSAGEVRSQLYVALDEGYISREEFDALARECHSITKMIYGLIRYLDGADIARERNRPRRH